MRRAVCFLDKAYPPEEAFIDGLLCPRSRESDARLYIVVAKGRSTRRVTRWKGAPCLCVLPARRGMGRILGPLRCFRLLVGLKRRLGDVRDVTIFARNDPSYLLASVIARATLGYGRVVHQNTFPLEQYFRGTAKGAVATWLFRRLLSHVDALLVLTPEARARLDALSPAKDTVLIPMCVERDFLVGDLPKPRDAFRLLYTGTHAESRGLDEVFRAAAEAHRRGARFELTSIGATFAEVRRLERLDAVRYLRGAGVLTLAGRTTRDDMPRILSTHHVGLCLIPPEPVFLESTPTKLIEYMAGGLYVLATKGIPFQERVVSESGAGVLVDFEHGAMVRAIESACERRHELLPLGVRGFEFARRRLACAVFRDDLDRALWGRRAPATSSEG